MEDQVGDSQLELSKVVVVVKSGFKKRQAGRLWGKRDPATFHPSPCRSNQLRASGLHNLHVTCAGGGVCFTLDLIAVSFVCIYIHLRGERDIICGAQVLVASMQDRAISLRSTEREGALKTFRNAHPRITSAYHLGRCHPMDLGLFGK